MSKFKSNKCHSWETLTRNGDITVITSLSLSLQLFFYIMIQSSLAERIHSQSHGILLLRSTQEAGICMHAVDPASKLHCTHVPDPALRKKIGKDIPQWSQELTLSRKGHPIVTVVGMSAFNFLETVIKQKCKYIAKRKTTESIPIFSSTQVISQKHQGPKKILLSIFSRECLICMRTAAENIPCHIINHPPDVL